MPDLTDDLERLAALHRGGSLTDAEYQQAKAKLLGDGRQVERLRLEKGLVEFDAAQARADEDLRWAWTNGPRTWRHAVALGTPVAVVGTALLVVVLSTERRDVARPLVGGPLLVVLIAWYYITLDRLGRRHTAEFARRRAELVARLDALPPDDSKPA